jgi:caa(3)-type oxidase subunit IV
MSEPHADPAAHADHVHGDHAHEGHISDKTFMKVFGALLIFTAGSYITNRIFGSHSPIANFALIGLIAICKAFLVVTFFMHLKIDWRKVFVFLVPICILAPMVIIVLWPDIVLGWRLAKP